MNVSKKILIVEDEALTSTLIKKYLEKWGHKVLGTISTGEKAIEFCQHNTPDIVLMDIQLAGIINGITTAAKIKNSCPNIIFITGFSDDNTKKRAFTLNPIDYITKPINMKYLENIIQSA